MDRGEIMGRDEMGGSLLTRLSTLRSAYFFPVDQWVQIETTLRLGTNVPRSSTVIDDFDADTTEAWVEIRVEEEDVEPMLVLRMAGSNMHDPDALRQVVERDAPGALLEVDEPIDLDIFQVGMTNNRSTLDTQIEVDSIVVEQWTSECP